MKSRIPCSVLIGFFLGMHFFRPNAFAFNHCKPVAHEAIHNYVRSGLGSNQRFVWIQHVGMGIFASCYESGVNPHQFEYRIQVDQRCNVLTRPQGVRTQICHP